MTVPEIVTPDEWRAARVAPLEKIERYKAKKGWTFAWYSSHGSDYNYDFDVTLDSSVQPTEFNHRAAPADWEEPKGRAGHARGNTPDFAS